VECSDFVLGLLCADADKRLTCPTALQHPWITGSQVGGRRLTIGEIEIKKAETEHKHDPQRKLLLTHLKEFRTNTKLKRTAVSCSCFAGVRLMLAVLAQGTIGGARLLLLAQHECISKITPLGGLPVTSNQYSVSVSFSVSVSASC
jgi:hypothetical protein